MDSIQQVQYAIQVLHYTGPSIVLLYYLVAATVSVCTLQSLKKPDQRKPQILAIYFMLFIMMTYIGEASMLVFDTFNSQPRRSTTDSNVYTISFFLVWSTLVFCLLDSKHPVWYPYYGSWFLALVLEIGLFSLSLATCRLSGPFDYTLLIIQISRLLALSLLVACVFGTFSKVTPHTPSEEGAPLLSQMDRLVDIPNTAYGSAAHRTSSDGADLEYEAEELKKEEEQKRDIEKRLKANGNWFTYVREFFIFIPYLWPSNPKDRKLRWNVLGVVICLACVRASNVLIPHQLGVVINALGTSRDHVPLMAICLYILYTLAPSSAGIQSIKDLLWFPVEQHAHKAIKTAAYSHIMGLSCDFHDDKQSGELYKSVEQGDSITRLLETVLFEALPMLIDLVVAYVYLYYLFGPYMALTVAATTIMYLWAATCLSAKQRELHRRYVGIWRKEYQVMYDTLGSWSTVTYFNRQVYERERYASIVKQNMLSQLKMTLTFYVSLVIQSWVLRTGFFGACVIAAYQVTNGEKSVGDFATLITYWAQLTGPLVFFSQANRELQGNLIDAEQLLQLFQQTPSIKDGQAIFEPKEYSVTFQDVRFSYDGKKQVINDISFNAKPSRKVALVGETGGGKSTVLKLLFRLYDVTHGSISIDGQDIRTVPLASLRESIGVVPQDPDLFNDTIMNNVRYSHLEATDEEVIAACKAAAVHDKIMTFTDGYTTRVGENGVKLSGGELQRVAIARAILKNPKIMLLDEATSSVDTETELQIQQALEKLTEGRTTFIVAHRLSTVMKADLMLVIKDGTIIERGSPRELLEAKGKYYNLWSKQNGIVSTSAKSEG